jgi:hypothetical protein
MELYERQQFDFLLMTAVERFCERIIQRNAGAANALARLQADANSEGIWLDDFVGAIFQDFLLDNVGGACFVLRALSQRSLNAPTSGKIGPMLITMARRAFADLLRAKTEEALEQASTYG